MSTPKRTPLAAVDQFIAGETGLFDWYVDYSHTPAFRRDLREYYQSHKNLIETDEAERAAYHREWARRNPDKVRAIQLRRAERIAALPNDFTESDWRHCLDYFGHRCAVCGRPQGLWHSIAKAHWIPLMRDDCPGTIPENIIPLCNGRDGCNNSQWGNHPIEWLELHLGKRKANEVIRRVEDYFNSLKSIAA